MKERTKTILIWCIAFLCVAGAAYALYRIEAAYAGVLRMNCGIWLGGFIGGCIGSFLVVGKKQNAGKKMSRKQIAIAYLILIALVALLFYCSRDMERMRIFPYQMLALLLPTLWADWRVEKGAARRCVMGLEVILSAILLVGLSFGAPKVLGYVTIAEAVDALAAQGYEDIGFMRDMRGNWLQYEAEDTSFYTDEMEGRYFYLFRGEKAGEDWVMVLDPANGESVLAASAADEPMLAERP